MEMTEGQIESLFEEYPNAIKMDGYDDSLIGVCERFGMETVFMYDKTKIVAKLMEDGMSYDEAVEFFLL